MIEEDHLRFRELLQLQEAPTQHVKTHHTHDPQRHISTPTHVHFIELLTTRKVVH